MKSKKIFITNSEWFENSTLKNPIESSDCNLEKHFPEFYSLDYDTKLLATNPPKNHEKTSATYNPYREKYGTSDIALLVSNIKQSPAKNIFLNGFEQEHFDYISPLIKDTAEIIYFFKCPKISNLSALSDFPNLKCVHIFYNNSLESLWDMGKSVNMKVLSFTMISKLCNIESLTNSFVEYIHFDSMDNSGNKKPLLFDPQVFDNTPKLKYLSLNFTDYETETTR